jgi:hypothetical protein
MRLLGQSFARRSRVVPRIELGPRLLLVATPHMGGDDARRAALGANRRPGRLATTGAVGEDLTGVVGKRVAAGLAVMNVGGGDGDLLDRRGVGISADVSSVSPRSPTRRSRATVSLAN